jgi:hypothetical protein
MFLHPIKRTATDTMYNAGFFPPRTSQTMPESVNFPCAELSGNVVKLPVLHNSLSLAFLAYS